MHVGIPYELHVKHTPHDVWSGKSQELTAYQEITCHHIFDIKMDFTWKAHFVANGTATDTPNSLTYSSVVCRDSVKLDYMLAALNDLDAMAFDIGNAYLNAPYQEKIWFEAG